jgi:hypothetical protein
MSWAESRTCSVVKERQHPVGTNVEAALLAEDPAQHRSLKAQHLRPE